MRNWGLSSDYATIEPHLKPGIGAMKQGHLIGPAFQILNDTSVILSHTDYQRAGQIIESITQTVTSCSMGGDQKM